MHFYRFENEIAISSFLKVKTGSRKFKNIFNDKILFFESCQQAISFYLNNIKTEKKLKIGVPLYTCSSVYQSVYSSEHQLKFLDIGINNKGYIFDLEIFKNLDVLIFVHYFGFYYTELKQIKEKYPNLIIIEDCSHVSLINYIPNNYTDIAVFSFNFHKPIVAGIGGAIYFNSEKNIDEFKNLYKNLKISSNFKKLLKIILINFAHYHIIYFFLKKKLERKREQNYVINISESIFPKQIPDYGKYILGNQIHKKRTINFYNNLSEKYRLKINNSDSLSYFPIFFETELKRNEILIEMKKNGIDAYILWEKTFYNAEFYGFNDVKNFIKTKNILDKVIFLPESFLNNISNLKKIEHLFEK